MGPIRGSKKRKRAEQKAEVNGGIASMVEGREPIDWWADFSKRIKGHLAKSKEPGKFESVFKISRKTFDYISSLVREGLTARSTKFTFRDGKVLTADDQVAVALRRLSSGESLLSVGTSFGMHHSIVSQVTWQFVEVMEEKGINHLKWPGTEEEMETIKSKFEKIRGLPNCCGAVDTTHITMCLSTADPCNKVWIDCEKNCSMVLQAIVDPDMRFRDIVTGWPGSLDESIVLRDSGFFKLCKKGERLNGNEMELLEGFKVREYIVGGSGFPLLPWLLTPYQGNNLTNSKIKYNKRHFATTMVAQRALARLKEMWRIIQAETWRPDIHKMPSLILVCCLLHNVVIDLENEAQDHMPLYRSHDSSYRQRCCDHIDKSGSILRDKLSQYLSGKLPP